MRESKVFTKVMDAMEYCYLNKITPTDIIALYEGTNHELVETFELLFDEPETPREVEKIIIIWEE